MSDDNPAPTASEKCAKCKQPWGEHVGDGHDEPICPDPPAPPPERTLTREERWYSAESTEALCRARDTEIAALREEVAHLNDGAKRNAALLAEQREIEKTLCEEVARLTRERDAHEYAAVRLKEMLDDEEKRVAALEKALREARGALARLNDPIRDKTLDYGRRELVLTHIDRALARIEEGKP